MHMRNAVTKHRLEHQVITMRQVFKLRQTIVANRPYRKLILREPSYLTFLPAAGLPRGIGLARGRKGAASTTYWHPELAESH